MEKMTKLKEINGDHLERVISQIRSKLKDLLCHIIYLVHF